RLGVGPAVDMVPPSGLDGGQAACQLLVIVGPAVIGAGLVKVAANKAAGDGAGHDRQAGDVGHVEQLCQFIGTWSPALKPLPGDSREFAARRDDAPAAA